MLIEVLTSINVNKKKCAEINPFDNIADICVIS